MTFSIAARCPESGQFGIAISSSSIAVGARCPWLQAGGRSGIESEHYLTGAGATHSGADGAGADGGESDASGAGGRRL